MKNLKHIGTLYIVICLLISTIIVMRFSGEKQDDVVTIPEEKGSFDIEKPTEILKDSIFVYQLRDTIIKYNRPVDTVYINKFIKASEVVKVEKYIEAVAKRQYKDTVDNDDIKINYVANTEGKLLNINFDYLIKEKTIEIPKPKEQVFALYGGAGLQSTTDLNKVVPVGTIGFQNKKGTIIYGQYGADNTIQVGAMVKIFNIKK